MAGLKEVSAKCSVRTEAVKEVFEAIKELAKAGEEIRIQGFGTFSKQHKEEREGRNPATGESLTIPAKDVFHFKVSKEATAAMNEKKVATGRRR